MKIAKNKALLSPRGVRVASSVSDHHWHCRPAVAVPVRGAGCIIHSSLKLSWLILPLPSPRGVRVASRARRQGRARHEVAVPVRGAGCIPHGKQELQGQELHHFSVPVRGAGCIGVVRKKNNFITLLPSPRGVRVASKNDCCTRRRANVAVPARGAGCIKLGIIIGILSVSCRPREGCGLHRQKIVVVTADSGCRPREGCGLHRRIR